MAVMRGQAMAVMRGQASSNGQDRNRAMAAGPGDCRVNMQAAMAMVLAKRWP